MKGFFSLYNEINKLLNNKESNFNTYYYKDKILDNKDNEEVLKDILLRNEEKNLMISQTGSGKTYSIIKASNQIDKVTIFTVPNRDQALQIGQEFKYLNVGVIVGGVDINKVIEEQKSKILIVVYDRLEEVLDYYRAKEQFINLIIDEAQDLVLANYRKVLDDIEKKFDISFKGLNYTNILYLTATPNTLMYLNFNNIFEFKQEKKDVFPQSYNIYYVDSIKNDLINKIVDNYNKGIKTYIRLNDKQDEGLRGFIEGYLRQECKDIKIVHASSEDKGNNKNELTKSVINNSCLPDADVYLSTCIFDKGINLNYIKNGNLNNLEVIYVVKSESDMLLDYIQQTEARIRNKYHKFSIMINNRIEDEETEEIEETNVIYKELDNSFIFRELDELTDSLYNRLLRRKTYLENEIQELKAEGYSNKKIKREIEEQFLKRTVDGYKANLDDSLEIIGLDIYVNLKNFFRFVYLKYNKQFYYNPELLKDVFMDNCTTEHISSEEVEFVIDDTEINDILEEIKTNKNILIPKNSKTEEELQDNLDKHNKVSKSWKFKEYYNLIELGKEEDEAIDIVKTSEKKEVSKIKNEIMIEELKNIKTKDLMILNDIVKHKDECLNEELKEKSLLIYKLKKTSLFDSFEKAIKKHYDLDRMIKHIIDGGSPAGFIRKEQYIQTNLKYLSGKKVRSFDDRVQYFIIDNIGSYENKDKAFLTANKLSILTTKINLEFKENYSVKDVEKVIKKIFNVGRDLRLNGLKIK